jgi:hypothetical protein
MVAQMMRRVLVDHARTRAYSKRGGGALPVALDESRIASPERDGQMVALDEALEALGRKDARKAQVVELRFFAGLSVEETAAGLGVSPQTGGAGLDPFQSQATAPDAARRPRLNQRSISPILPVRAPRRGGPVNSNIGHKWRRIRHCATRRPEV